MIRVILPNHLQSLSSINREVELDVEGTATISKILDLLEEQYPMLRGTIRDHVTKERRPFLRFFACGEDLTLDPQDTPLPAKVIQGTQPLRIVGAMAGG